MTTLVNSVFGMDTDGSDGGPFWLHWLTSEVGDIEVKAVYGPIPQAASGNVFEDRVYYTGQYDSGSSGLYRPKVTTRAKAINGPGTDYPYEWLIIGVPAPENPPSVSSEPDVSTTLFADGSSLAGWTSSGGVTANDNTLPAPMNHAFKLTGVSELHTDIGTMDETASGMRFNYEAKLTSTYSDIELRFSCDAVGNGPSIYLQPLNGAFAIPPFIRIGTAPTWAGAAVYEPFIAMLPSDCFQYDVPYEISLSLLMVTALEWSVTISIKDIAAATTTYSNTFTIGPPLGSYAGFRKSQDDSYINDIYTTDVATFGTVGAVVYAYTFLNEFGEEGPPSPVAQVNFALGYASALIVPDPSPTDAADYGLNNTGFGTKRLYRSVTGGASTELQKLADIPYGTTAYSDGTADEELGAVNESSNYDLPPVDGHSILASPNGITFMASKNEICPSVQNRPHAYPITFRLQTDLPIIGMGIIDTNVVVATQEFPYLVVGSEPEGLSMAKLELKQGCASRRSFATLKDVGVVYASPDGLVCVSSAGGVKVITEAWLSRREWQELNPASIIGAVHDDRYFGFYNNGAPGAFLFDPKEGGNGFTLLDLAVQCAFTDSFNDNLQLVIEDDLRQWDAADTERTFIWRSKVFDMPRPVALTCAQVKADDYTGLEFRYYVDGVLVLERVVTSQQEFVLPEVVGNRVEFEVEGTGVVTGVQLAENMDELQ